MTAYGYVGTCAMHSTPSLSAPRSHGKLRSMLTGTGVGSNFRFVSDLELLSDSVETRNPPSVHCGLTTEHACEHEPFAVCFGLFLLVVGIFIRIPLERTCLLCASCDDARVRDRVCSPTCPSTSSHPTAGHPTRTPPFFCTPFALSPPAPGAP